MPRFSRRKASKRSRRRSRRSRRHSRRALKLGGGCGCSGPQSGGKLPASFLQNPLKEIKKLENLK